MVTEGKDKTFNVLLIEDDVLLQEILSLVFREMNLSLVSIDNLNNVNFILQDKPFDAAIIDYALLDGFGPDIVPLLRSRNPQIKIIGISSFDVEEKFKNAGADIFIRKPFNVVPFARTIREIIEKGSTNQA